MATVTGSAGIFKAVTAGGSVANVGEVRSYTFDSSADTIEDTAMGDTARTYKAGQKNSTISIEAYFDSSDTAQADLVNGAEIDFELHPEGTGTGTPVYSNTTGKSAIVTASNFSASFDGMVEASFTIQVSGEVVIGTN